MLEPFHFWGAPIVSIFFFISGYGLMSSYKTKGGNYLSGFFKHRLLESVALSFLLAYILYRCMADTPSILASVSLLAADGVTTLPHSWYVFAILIFYTAFYLSCRIMKGKYILLLLVLLCTAYSIGTKQLGYARCWYITALAFPAGAFYACHWEKRLSAFGKFNLTIPASLLLSAVLYSLRNETAYMLVYVLLPFMVVYLCSTLKIERAGKIRIVRWLSSISYEIYLCQGISMSLLRGHYFSIDSDIFYVIGTFVLTFFLAYSIKKVRMLLISYGI